MKLMSKDDMIELYVNTVNKIINDKVEGDLDSHIWISLVAKKDMLEQVLGIVPKNLVTVPSIIPVETIKPHFCQFSMLLRYLC